MDWIILLVVSDQNGRNIIYERYAAYYYQLLTMSELLVVRRQKFVREIRRKEVDQYMKTIRDKLISNSY